MLLYKYISYYAVIRLRDEDSNLSPPSSGHPNLFDGCVELIKEVAEAPHLSQDKCDSSFHDSRTSDIPKEQGK